MAGSETYHDVEDREGQAVNLLVCAPGPTQSIKNQIYEVPSLTSSLIKRM